MGTLDIRSLAQHRRFKVLRGREIQRRQTAGMRLRVGNRVTSIRLWEPLLIEEPGNFANDGDRDRRGSSAVSLQQSRRAKTVHVTEGG